MQDSLNVHWYDGKIGSNVPPISLNLQEKQYLLQQFQKNIETKISPSANMFLKMIIQDIGRPPNYCDQNKVWAEDVLIQLQKKLINHKEQSDILKTLSEQLSDISSGQCPSGRVTRLIQVLYSC